MKIPESIKKDAVDTAEKSVKESMAFVPMTRPVYAAQLGSENSPKAFESAKIGEAWYNREIKVADRGESFTAVPISYRGRLEIKLHNDDKKTITNPCFNEGVVAEKTYHDEELVEKYEEAVNASDVKKADLGVDVLVYLPEVEKFSVIPIKKREMEGFLTMLGDCPSVKIGYEKIDINGGAVWFKLSVTENDEEFELPEADIITYNKVYQKIK